MNDPYRSSSCPDASSGESNTPRACFICGARVALARLPARTAFAAVLAVGVFGANIACALLSYSLAREQREAVASLDATVSAIVRHASPRAAPALYYTSQDPVAPQPNNRVVEWEPEFVRQVQIVPESQQGRVLGFRLFGIKSFSLLGALGIENGDRIDAINGYEMSSPENALSAYESFRQTNDLVVRLNRRGRAMTLHYALR
jgi:general secretion pathway protein C